MTLDQLGAEINSLPQPRNAEEHAMYRAEVRRLEAAYSAALIVPLDLEALDRLADESRPSGPIHESPEWDLHFARVDQIERACGLA